MSSKLVARGDDDSALSRFGQPGGGSTASFRNEKSAQLCQVSMGCRGAWGGQKGGGHVMGYAIGVGGAEAGGARRGPPQLFIRVHQNGFLQLMKWLVTVDPV